MRQLRLQWRSAAHHVRKFCDESHYGKLVTASTAGIGPDGDLVFAYRQAVFTAQEQRAAYAALLPVVKMTTGRGDAAGPVGGQLGNRDWVTPGQVDIIRRFLGLPLVRRRLGERATRGPVWLRSRVLADHPQYDGWFDRWYERTKRLSAPKRKASAKRVLTYLSRDQSMPVPSGTAGYAPWNPEFTTKHPEQFAKSFPFVRRLNAIYRETCPEQWQAQAAATDQIDPRLLIAGTVFSTLTANYNWRTAAHVDKGNLDVGFSCLVGLGSGWQGGEFILPEYRVAINLQPGDLLMLPSHEVIHANAPLRGTANDRLTVVAYVPKDI